MTAKSLEDILQSGVNPTGMLRHSQIGAYIYPVVPSEFTNWRDEQRAWRETCVLYDQSHHMVDIFVEGPDALKMLSSLTINSFKNFSYNRAKQFVATSYDGYVIGDGILFPLAEEEFVFVGRNPTANWIQFHGETGGWDVEITYDDRSPSRPWGNPVSRTHYRYQIQGPNAEQVIEKLNGGPYPDIKFFHMGTIQIAGRTVRALRHGMAGEPGLEVWGPYAERDEIREAILEAGQEFGITMVGSRAYSSNTLESGWIPSPLPAVYSGDSMKAYREWLPANGYEAAGSIGGSFYSDNIEDYYVTPYDLGYAPFMRFDHDFAGSEALQAMADGPHRKKVTFAWNPDDVTEVIRSMFEPSDPYKYIDFPNTNYTSATYDRIMKDGKHVGFSMFGGYSYNERSMLSLGIIDEDVELGDEVILVWGEEDGGSRKTTVERHRQFEMRAIVSPAPYTKVVREKYADGWRTAVTA